MNEQLQKEIAEQKEYYEQQITSLEEENKRLIDTLIRHSKSKAASNVATPVN